jgi:predicted transporter
MKKFSSFLVAIVFLFGITVGLYAASPDVSLKEGTVTITQDTDSQQYDYYAAKEKDKNKKKKIAVPEPSTLLLLGSGMAGLIGFGILRKKLKK